MADFDTLRIRAGYDSADHNYAVNVPIYQTVSFDLGSTGRADALWAMEEDGPIYTRIGGNPTAVVLEERIKALDQGYAAVALSSGMAAISYTVLALTEGGGNIVASHSLYGGSEDSFAHFFPRFGAQIKFVEDRFDPASYEKEIDENTRGIYIETISNPNIELYDVEAIAEVAHRHNIPLITDNTVATPYLFHPFQHGADIVIYSATKAIGGHGSTVAGLILESGNFHYDEKKFPQFYEKSYKIRDLEGNRRSAYDVDPRSPLIIHLRAFYLEFIGASLSAFDAYLILQGLDTISERVEKETRNAEKLAEFLSGQEHVSWVKYPGLADSPYKALADRYFPKGAGSLLSFGFDGTDEQLDRFFKHLKYFSYHVNIGDVRSLIVNSPKTTHAEMDPEHLSRAGISTDTVRISAGLESVDDLIGDLKSAFSAVFGEENEENERLGSEGDLSIGGVAEEDLDAISEIENMGFPEGKAASKEAILHRFNDFPQGFLAARSGDRIVGFVNGAPSHQRFITDDLFKSDAVFDLQGENLILFSLAVHPDFRDRGIAAFLLNGILREAVKDGRKRAVLTCREKLIPYYESFGFVNRGVSESVTGGIVWYNMDIEL